eukprot:7385491-Prymnesium_polylepis.1
MTTSIDIASNSPRLSDQHGLQREHSSEVKRIGSPLESTMIAGSFSRKRWPMDQPHERSSCCKRKRLQLGKRLPRSIAVSPRVRRGYHGAAGGARIHTA